MSSSDSDWELLDHSSTADESSPISDFDLDDVNHSDGALRLDHFSLDYSNQRSEDVADDVVASDEGSDNPSWIEPPMGNMGELWSDSGSGGGETVVSADHDSMEDETATMKSSDVVEEREILGEGNSGLTEPVVENSGDLWFDSGSGAGKAVVGQTTTLKTTDGVGEREICGESSESLVVETKEEKREENLVEIEKREVIEEEAVVKGERKEEEKRVVWWKAPLELLRCCVLKVSPAWSFSVAAAAVMGFVILGRRLYRMKRRTQAKVSAVDDKKVSQLISHAARLNEAFSVVRRVPVIRPALPSQPGVAPWPVLSLR
ncbi:hypothetical protein Droror1_Dr00011320 [Drosera rotundifolia]